MKAGRSVQDLAREVERQRAAMMDFITDTRIIGLTDDDDTPARLQTSRGAFGITPIAHQQIADKTGIPFR